MMDRKAIFSKDLKEYRKTGATWDFFDEQNKFSIHSIHPYPAKFIPQIPRKAIKLWSKPGDVVLDPFCGSGTALYESICLGRPAIGIDNNDVAVLISRAKTIKYSHKDYLALIDFEKNLTIRTENAVDAESVIPNYREILYWFDNRAIRELSTVKCAINELPEKARIFALAIFSAIIVRVSYQDSDTRYARIHRKYIPGTTIKMFKSKLHSSIRELEKTITVPKSDCKVYLADSRNLDFLKGNSVNLIVTSPPYLNAYDYHKYHRHRLQWIDGDVPFARGLEIGKHDTFTRPNANPKRYFDDMQKCINEWKRILKPKGRAFVIIGDAIVNGQPVAVGDEFIELFEKSGFNLEQRMIRNLKKTSKSFNSQARIDEENLLLFKKK